MNQKSTSSKIRIVIISGALETSIHPVPPVADGAPEWNVFRLAEAAGKEADGILDIHVISPCEAGQLQAVLDFKSSGQYHHIVFPAYQLWLYRQVLRHLFPLRLITRWFAKLPDMMSWWYLRRVKPLMKKISPDIVFINARPQYIRYLRPLVNTGRLWFFMRGEMGESRRFLYLLDGIVVNSDGMKDYTQKFIQNDKVPIIKIPNTLGEEFNVSRSMPDRFRNKKPIILFAGRIIPDKGVVELINAFEKVLLEIPNAELWICGASENYKLDDEITSYEQQLRQKAACLPAGKIVFKGYVPNKHLGDYYSQAHLVVFPSLCKESFGMVALEAMRCGTPIVASRQPGFEELVIPGETGLLVEYPRDSYVLAQAILKLLKNSDLAQQMGASGYLRSLEYLPAKALKCLKKIGQDILNG